MKEEVIKRLEIKHTRSMPSYKIGFEEGRQSKLKDELKFLKRLAEYKESVLYPRVIKRIKQISKELAGGEEE